MRDFKQEMSLVNKRINNSTLNGIECTQIVLEFNR